MYIPAWLIPFVAVLLWACYYYRYGYLELKRKAGKSKREAKQEDNLNSNAGDGVYPIPSADSLRILTGLG